MLRELFVKNLALINEIRLTIEDDLMVISGETGAGKSLLVESIALIIGERASPGLIRTGEKEAIIEAVFEIESDHPVLEYLEDSGLKEGYEIIIRRQIATKGRSRIYVNGQSVTLGQLKEIGSSLIDLSGQHDQQVLLDQNNHGDLLDQCEEGLGIYLKKVLKRTLDTKDNLIILLEEYQGARRPYLKAKAELETLIKKSQDQNQNLDFLRFQLEEIDKAKLDDPQEEEKLIEEKARVKHGDFLFQTAKYGAYTLLDSEKSVLSEIDNLLMKLDKAVDADPSLSPLLGHLSLAKENLTEAAHGLGDYASNLDITPGRLEEIESRLFTLHQVKKKYGLTLEEVLKTRDRIYQELHEVDNIEELISAKQKEVLKLAQRLLTLAHKIHDVRIKRAKELEKVIQNELGELSMPVVYFSVHMDYPIKPTIDDCGEKGYDDIAFLMSANPGEDPKPIVQIASGGELSRILLALKSVLGRRAYPMTYVFDEIDTGIGGAVAEVIGRKLKLLAQGNQLLCVTHLAQIAAYAKNHFVISKSVEESKTKTSVSRLESKDQVVHEIARMMGGVDITDKTREHALEMINSALKSA